MNTGFSLIMVGMDLWNEFTLPAIQSIHQHENVNILLVDHGKTPYPETEGVEILRLNTPVCYSKALNLAIEHREADWYFTMNNDVLCKGPFLSEFEGFSPDKIYAHKIFEKHGKRWFDNCFVAISNETWKKVGQFDEGFRVCAFEDADYSFRAKEQGIETVLHPFPFLHRQGQTRWGIEHYSQTRMDNYAYLLKKHGLEWE